MKERKNGKEIGKQESKLEIAKKLIVMGMSKENICEATGLKINEVEKLYK